jgi:hypothetical protein
LRFVRRCKSPLLKFISAPPPGAIRCHWRKVINVLPRERGKAKTKTPDRKFATAFSQLKRRLTEASIVVKVAMIPVPVPVVVPAPVMVHGHQKATQQRNRRNCGQHQR